MIRYASFNDIAAINRLGKYIDDNFDILFNLNDILNSKYDKIYVCEKDNTVCGFLHFIVLVDSVDIINIAVDENYRNQGIGTLLLDYMFDSLDISINDVKLEVAVDNENAINLYKKLNFEIINIRKKYYRKKDAYLMERKLR